MIFDFIISTLCNFATAVFGILPTIPATPSAIVSGGSWVTDTIGAAISILNMLYTPTLLGAVIIVAIAIFNFEWLYHGIMWILRKIPILNIK